MDIQCDDLKLKELVKEAIVEVLEQRSDLIAAAVEEALEDARLLQAMEQTRNEGLADREEVARLLSLRI